MFKSPRQDISLQTSVWEFSVRTFSKNSLPELCSRTFFENNVWELSSRTLFENPLEELFWSALSKNSLWGLSLRTLLILPKTYLKGLYLWTLFENSLQGLSWALSSTLFKQFTIEFVFVLAYLWSLCFISLIVLFKHHRSLKFQFIYSDEEARSVIFSRETRRRKIPHPKTPNSGANRGLQCEHSHLGRTIPREKAVRLVL